MANAIYFDFFTQSSRFSVDLRARQRSARCSEPTPTRRSSRLLRLMPPRSRVSLVLCVSSWNARPAKAMARDMARLSAGCLGNVYNSLIRGAREIAAYALPAVSITYIVHLQHRCIFRNISSYVYACFLLVRLQIFLLGPCLSIVECFFVIYRVLRNVYYLIPFGIYICFRV